MGVVLLLTGVGEEGLEVGLGDPLGVAHFVRVGDEFGVVREEEDVVDCKGTPKT